MNFLNGLATQVQVWNAYAALNQPDPATRQKAMQTLRDAGPSSLPALRFGLQQQSNPHVQFSSAVVLHHLGDGAGLETLCDALQYRLFVAPMRAGELEAAFIAIGAPDATTALLDVWRRLPKQEENKPVLALICRVWAALRDPRALDALLNDAIRLPDLFESTVPTFGELAVAPLERMARETDFWRRLLAINTLRHIVTARSFAALSPLLRDDNPQIRSATIAALQSVNETAAIQAIADALAAGYSTPEAIHALGRVSTSPREFNRMGVLSLCLALMERWQPRVPTTHDTEEAVLAAIQLAHLQSFARPRLTEALCGLLERQPGPRLAHAAIGSLAFSLPTRSEMDARVHRILYANLMAADAPVRREAARVLVTLGDRIGLELDETLQDCWLQSNLLDKLQTLLRGDADANTFATQAAEQVTRWFSRVSKDVASRREGTNPAPSAPALDGRLPTLIRQLLQNALTALRYAPPAEWEEPVALSVAAIRALCKVGEDCLRESRAELLLALRTVKSLAPPSASHATPMLSAGKDKAQPVRAAAAQALIEGYGADSFVFFLESLYAPEGEVVGTAIAALGRLGDLRAVSHLQPIAGNAAHPHQVGAQEALAAIRRVHPEAMSLLRASSASDARPDTLLRAAMGNNDAVPADQLLRSSAPET